MQRLLFSLIFGFMVGLGASIYSGWVLFPAEFTNSPIQSLSQSFRDDFTVMVANGYRVDSDTISAVERLRLLDEENIPQYVQSVTERYISNSRDVNDIRALVALSDALGRLTPIMEPYRDVRLPATDGG